MLGERQLRGVLPVVQTPFDQSGGLDFDALKREVEWILEQGAAGVTMGMVSEILRLSSSERLELAEALCGLGQQSSAAVVISCGAESTRVAADFAADANKRGADAVMAAPPTTVALEDDALWGYYSEIIQCAATPLIVQDASGYVGQPLSIALQVRLIDTYGDMVYFKPEADPVGPRLSALREATHGRARVFEGSGGASLLDSYRRGVIGTMPGAEVCWAIGRLWNALEAGDWKAAYRISGPLTSLVMMQSGIDGYVAIEKHLLVRQGVLESAAARGPLAFTLDAETAAEVDRLFDLLQDAARSGPPDGKGHRR